MSTPVDNASTVPEHPRIATGVIDGVPWSLFALPEDETNWWTGFEHKLVIKAGGRVASWGKRVFVMGETGGAAPVSVPPINNDHLGDFGLIHYPHPSNGLDGWDNEDEAVDEVMPFLVAGYFSCRKFGVIFRPDDQTLSGFSHSTAARVRDVLMNGKLSPAQAWLAFLAAGCYPLLSLELIADLVAVRSSAVLNSIPEHSTLTSWGGSTASSLVVPLSVGRNGFSPNDMDDTLWWYCRRAAEVFLRSLLSFAVGPISSWQRVSLSEYDAAMRAGNVRTDGERVISLIGGTGDEPAWDQFEMFAGSVDDQGTFDRIIAALSEDEKVSLSCLIGDITELVAVEDIEAMVEKDVAILSASDLGIQIPVMVTNASNGRVFRPLPVGFFERMADLLASDDSPLERSHHSGEFTDGLTDMAPFGRGSIIERSYSFRGGDEQPIESLFHWTQLNGIVTSSIPSALTDTNARGDWVRTQTEDLHRISIRYDQTRRELNGMVYTSTGARMIYADWHQSVRNALVSYYSDSADQTLLLWHLRLSGIDASIR